MSLGAVPFDAPVATNVPFVAARHVSAPHVGTLNCFVTSPEGRDQTAGTAAAITTMYANVFMLLMRKRMRMRWLTYASAEIKAFRCRPGNEGV